ncbi:MAG: hypothetical protein CVU65_05865 [Deltaproteobacteria bacterium HGW-Deltaproteobacteria-22]|nr:MAG: hypothetical protein CVU65_05865 [Deltaproteobacteria bacterium HGW-Deltaproteobacteria-22]
MIFFLHRVGVWLGDALHIKVHDLGVAGVVGQFEHVGRGEAHHRRDRIEVRQSALASGGLRSRRVLFLLEFLLSDRAGSLLPDHGFVAHLHHGHTLLYGLHLEQRQTLKVVLEVPGDRDDLPCGGGLPFAGLGQRVVAFLEHEQQPVLLVLPVGSLQDQAVVELLLGTGQGRVNQIEFGPNLGMASLRLSELLIPLGELLFGLFELLPQVPQFFFHFLQGRLGGARSEVGFQDLLLGGADLVGELDHLLAQFGIAVLEVLHLVLALLIGTLQAAAHKVQFLFHGGDLLQVFLLARQLVFHGDFLGQIGDDAGEHILVLQHLLE